jgi:hypothetical protein
MRADDLVPLLLPESGAGLGFRQGVVVEWNPETAENQILIGGTVMQDLPILNTSEAALLAPGAVVGVITNGATWFVLGRITIPNTPEAASALQLVSGRFVTDMVATMESTSSGSYGDLATVGPQVTVRVSASGKLLLILSAATNFNSAAGGTDGGALSFAVTGETSIVAGTYPFFDIGGVSGSVVFGRAGTASGAILLTGLNPGEHTVTAKYISSFGRSVSFYNRVLIALPL